MAEREVLADLVSALSYQAACNVVVSSREKLEFAQDRVWAAVDSAQKLLATPPVAVQEDDRKIIATYDKLHEGKLGAHWLWCVIEQIAAGVPEAAAMRFYGYYTPVVSRIGIGFPSTKGDQP